MVGFQEELMITRGDNLPPVGEFAQPVVKITDGRGALAERGEVTSVDQNVPIGYL